MAKHWLCSPCCGRGVIHLLGWFGYLQVSLILKRMEQVWTAEFTQDSEPIWEEFERRSFGKEHNWWKSDLVWYLRCVSLWRPGQIYVRFLLPLVMSSKNHRGLKGTVWPFMNVLIWFPAESWMRRLIQSGDHRIKPTLCWKLRCFF